MTYKVAKTLGPVDAAYIAGLVDGEGTVTLSRRNRYKHRGLVVVISNTEMTLLKHVQAKLAWVKSPTKEQQVPITLLAIPTTWPTAKL